MDDVNFLVNCMSPDSRSYLSYRSLNRGGVECDTLDIFVFDGAAGCFAKGSECCGLLFFYHDDGDVLICNPTTKERKLVPPSQVSDRDLHGDIYYGYGFGYDDSSQDFKILRFFQRHGKDTCEYRGDLPMRAEIYSFKKNYWKRIRCRKDLSCVDYLSENSFGAFVNGNLYWAASFSEDVYDGVDNALLSFNLASEDFSLFPLPYPTAGIEKHLDRLLQDMFEFDGELGAVVYETHSDDKFRACVTQHPGKPEVGTQIWVWKPEAGSWEMKFRFLFRDVVRPLGLNYGRLYLEVRTGGNELTQRTGGNELTQLRVYDLNTNEIVNLEVCARLGEMAIFPYRRTTFPLPKDAVDVGGSL